MHGMHVLRVPPLTAVALISEMCFNETNIKKFKKKWR